MSERDRGLDKATIAAEAERAVFEQRLRIRWHLRMSALERELGLPPGSLRPGFDPDPAESTNAVSGQISGQDG